MPIYEYRCSDCGGISEKLVGVVQETSEPACDHCGSPELTKVFSQIGYAAKRTPEPCRTCPGHQPSAACEAAGCPNLS